MHLERICAALLISLKVVSCDIDFLEPLHHKKKEIRYDSFELRIESYYFSSELEAIPMAHRRKKSADCFEKTRYSVARCSNI